MLRTLTHWWWEWAWVEPPWKTSEVENGHTKLQHFHPRYKIKLDSADLFCKGPNTKYLWLSGPAALRHSSSTLLLCLESSSRQHGPEWVCLCSDNTLFGDTEIWILCNILMSQILFIFLSTISNMQSFPNWGPYKNKKQIVLDELLHTYSERLMLEVSSSVTYNCNKISVPLKHKQ